MNHLQPVLWFILATVLAVLGYNIFLVETTPPAISYTTLVNELANKRISEMHLKGAEVRGEDIDGHTFVAHAPDVGRLLDLIDSDRVELTAEADSGGSIRDLIRTMIPVVLILGGWHIYAQSRSGSRARSRAGRFTPNQATGVTFNDVAGMAEAQAELKEVVDFLRFPDRFSRLGGRIPRGVLLLGPPGTGKTLLAKAIAGEASVPFFSLGGSDFVEMFVGVGASRVRDLFTEAKRRSPCIVFIDEIDAIGGRRSGMGKDSGSEEREQTLNALLVEMDGFASNQTVIIIAATNRPDVLDPALLRPGRFDRQIAVSIPDLRDRVKILAVHLRKIKAGPGLGLEDIARSIPGFSGADIANLVNEAALTAARKGKQTVDIDDIEHAKDKIVLGLERRSLVLTEETRRITAYHEAGHAITARQLAESDPVHKITIIPRGRALGLTQQVTLDERMIYSREYLLNRIRILLGGRAAEQLIFGRFTTGAGNDILAATELAGRLVCEWGMSERIGPVAYADKAAGHRHAPLPGPLSERTARIIDTEIQRLLNDCHSQTKDLLAKNDRFLHKLAEALLVNETLDAEEIDIVHNCTLREHLAEEAARQEINSPRHGRELADG